MMGSDIIYQQVAWMQPVKDKGNGKEFYTLGPVEGRTNTLAVTPIGGKGETLFYCQTHQFAYRIHEACLECRMQVREVPTGGDSEDTRQPN
jgi:hypothetical protein